MNDWKKKTVLGFVCVAAMGAFGFATTTRVSADTVKTVQSGDTLWGVSQTTGQSVDDLKSVNHLTSDVVYVGQHLTIGDSTVTAPADTVKIVQSGDTLWDISQTTGQSVDNIKSVNHLTSDVIYVGQRLTIGGSTVTTPAATSTPAATTTQTQAPVQQTTQVPVQQTSTPAQAPVQQTTQASVQQTSTPAQAPVQQTSTPAPTQSTTIQAAAPAANDSSAKSWIAQRESGDSYTAQNGQYYGKYQLSASYLNGDYSAANQERVADAYVNSRYGSWDNAKQHWVTSGWY